MILKPGLGEAVLAADVVAQCGQVAELPLARGVVHQADDADLIGRAEPGHLGDRRFRTDLGAQVQEMADPERALCPQGQDVVGRGTGIFAMLAVDP